VQYRAWRIFTACGVATRSSSLVPAQRHVNHINSLVAPDHDENSRFRGWNGLAVAAGGIFLALMILGLTLKAGRHR
jgi:hypothetical protein